MIKKFVAGIWLFLLVGTIVGLFWYNDFMFRMPTPVPESYKTVSHGSTIKVHQTLDFKNDKPIFLHFFNPDCPCSRFNISHVKSLIKTYGKDLNFAVVIMTDKPYTAEKIQKRFGLKIPIVKNDELASSCGVYSTPQAVILSSNHELYYRGNYNKTRYCTDEKTSYAKLAIEGVLQNKRNVRFDALALTAYGCTLPNCAE